MQPVAHLVPALPTASRDLLGTVISFVLFLVVLPSWVRIRWSTRHPWKQLGLQRSNEAPAKRWGLLFGLTSAAGGLLLLISLISFCLDAGPTGWGMPDRQAVSMHCCSASAWAWPRNCCFADGSGEN